MWRLWLCLACSLVVSPAMVGAATRTAASSSYSDVSTAVLSSSIGDTVHVPAGSAAWNTTLFITKGIYLVGAGAGQTVITNVCASDAPLIHYDPADYSTDQPFRLSGFTFCANGRHTLDLGSGRNGPFPLQTKVRVDHNIFLNGGADVKGQSIRNFGSLYGVVDNNTFNGVGYPISNSYGVGGDSWWANSPQNIFQHGSLYYLYYEDNAFINMSGYSGGADNLIMDGEYASRYVFRYNSIENNAASYSLLEMHGQQGEGASSMPASFGAEAYGNNVVHGSNTMVFWKQRSGQSLVFLNNAVTSSSPSMTAYTSAVCSCPVNYAALKITHNSYWWGSRKNYTGAIFSASATGGLNCNGLTNIPTIGRDIFTDTSSPPVTSGPLANLPATCAVGQGYWATEQSTTDLTGMVGRNPATPIAGTLYRCLVANTWQAYYTPFTYPHPLRVETGESLAPEAPTRLRLK
jgi:hypothetical protein